MTIRTFEVNARLSAKRMIRYASSLTWAEMKAKADAFAPSRLMLRFGIQGAYSRESRVTVIGLQSSLILKQSADGPWFTGRFTPAFGEWFVTASLVLFAAMALFAPTLRINGEAATWPMRIIACAAVLTLLGLVRFYMRLERKHFVREAERFLGLDRMDEAAPMP